MYRRIGDEALIAHKQDMYRREAAHERLRRQAVAASRRQRRAQATGSGWLRWPAFLAFIRHPRGLTGELRAAPAAQAVGAGPAAGEGRAGGGKDLAVLL
jgi:hypothetical protein